MSNTLQATNNFVLLIRDQVQKETNGLIIPGESRVKPHKGTIFSVGDLVQHKYIKEGIGKKGIFHQGIGFEIEEEGIIYLVLQANEIIAVV